MYVDAINYFSHSAFEIFQMFPFINIHKGQNNAPDANVLLPRAQNAKQMHSFIFLSVQGLFDKFI